MIPGDGSGLRPAAATLQRWALREDPELITGSVADDAAVQLAHRDEQSRSFLEFAARWVPVGEMTVERFERFASAWERAQGEKVVSHMLSEVSIPEDLKESPEA